MVQGEREPSLNFTTAHVVACNRPYSIVRRAGLNLLAAEEHLAALSTALNTFPGGEPSLEQSERKDVLNRMNTSQQTAIRSAEDSVYRAGGFEQLLLPQWKRYIDAHPGEFFSS
jgi:hypothetical protein